jgi:hypothetical protein
MNTEANREWVRDLLWRRDRRFAEALNHAARNEVMLLWAPHPGHQEERSAPGKVICFLVPVTDERGIGVEKQRNFKLTGVHIFMMVCYASRILTRLVPVFAGREQGHARLCSVRLHYNI